ncbi:Crp/Fnr family transcriptional regulator [Roseibium algae]|uniref:Crp/Fnr family transcriptional regulator n=1 Tax=Roseibium algae TaxID=3123038 RepID=A0ABU8TQ44_9HYPH
MIKDININQVFEEAGLKSTLVSFKKDQHLFWEGDPVTRMHVVLEGNLILLRRLENGQELIMQRAGPQDLLAEASLFSSRYHCDAIAALATVCTTYDVRDVQSALENRAFSLSVLKSYAAEIRSLRTQLELRNIKRADDRIMTYLTSLSADDSGWRAPSRPWIDVARSLGLSHEACYRGLTSLVKQQKIEKSDGQYRLLAKGQYS